MGSWPYMALRLPDLLGRPIQLNSIPASSAPAGGSAKKHAAQHGALIAAALGEGGQDEGDGEPGGGR
jgi:2-oxoglutarate dehydrogenase E1 component